MFAGVAHIKVWGCKQYEHERNGSATPEQKVSFNQILKINMLYFSTRRYLQLHAVDVPKSWAFHHALIVAHLFI